MPYHRLLARQLKQFFQGDSPPPKNWHAFLDAVDKAYREADEDRSMLERSLELSSQELLQANSEMRAVVQAFPDIFFLLGADGTILDYKGGSETDFLLPPQQLVGKRIQDIPLGEVGKRFESAIQTVQDSKGLVSLEYALSVHRQDVFYEARLVPLHESQILVIVRNITGRKQLEEQLRQTQKMEAIGKLAGGIAHDFNNILTAILGYGGQLLRRLPGDLRLRRPAEAICQAAERAAGLTRQLLAFSRRQVLQPASLDLNVVVGNMVELFQRLIGEHISVVMALDQAIKPIKADLVQLEQVLVNLAVNARDAMPQGGTLTLTTESVELDAAAADRLGCRPGAYAKLIVRDTGCRMDDTAQAHCFEPFFTTKPVGKGTGLGLATVYGVVQQSKGAIEVDSEPGRGTAFQIYLPLAHHLESTAHQLYDEPLSETGSETILLVEDEATLRELIRDTLQENGYVVLEACNAEEALQLERQSASPIQLLLTDVVMPGMNGWELAECLLESNPQLKVLYISGYTDDTIVQNGILEQGIPFLLKPFTPPVLERKVRQVLAAPPKP
ncbi:MAG: response regulator [Nitrospirota bacterium]|nr:response regulator [Nitrospirota bacterium]MDE3241393.1 response regulator [Nitrospirota bacterium]